MTGTPRDLVPDLPGRIDTALESFDLRAATGALREALDTASRFVDAERPWTRPDGVVDVLATLVRACRIIAIELEPFLPDGSARLRTPLGTGRFVGYPQPAFARCG